MNKSSITKGAVSLLILVAGWASPSVLVSSQETPEELVPTVTQAAEPVRLQVTSDTVELEYGEALDPMTLVVAGRYDTLSLPMVDTNQLGEQTLTFKATTGLDEITLNKTISVIDSTVPEFTDTANHIKVDYEETMEEADLASFFAATDNVDGNLDVQIDGEYDDTDPGEYNLTAYVVDSSGNRIEHSFKVTVREKPQPKVTYNSVSYTPASGSKSYGTSNTYGAGWCTWWAAQRRIEVGRPLPNTLGDAKTWIGRATAYGLSVGYDGPRVGAIIYPSYNHVAFVEQVNSDGSIVISEMGWKWQAWNKNVRTLSASVANSSPYIY